MTATKLQTKGYDSILHNLREHKDKIDRAIQALEALQESALPSADLLGDGDASLPRSDSYADMQFIDAVRKLFGKKAGPLTTSQITEALLDGGFSSESESPKKVIAAQLHRYAEQPESGIAKAGRGLWAPSAALKK